MAIFGKKDGGLMDVIRCDEQEYLIWKWRPKGATLKESKKAQSIRYGSSLRVKDGEIAVFVYKQKDGTMQDFIIGPYDETIKTANFPILTSIVGLAFGGNSPFQAEIYFINLSGNVQIKFGVPYFDVIDPRFLDFAVPIAVRGTLTFNITDYHNFIKLNRLINFELEDFKKQIGDAVKRYIKGVVTNIPQDNGIPVIQIERKILEVNEIVYNYLKPRLENDFGVNGKAVDIANIEIDKESEGYSALRNVTAKVLEEQTEAQKKAIRAQGNVQEKLVSGMVDATILDATMSAKTKNISVHQIDKQAEVGVAASEGLGGMGNMNIGGSSGGGMGFNPIGMMVGMGVGSALGQSMGGMVGNVMQPVNQQMNQVGQQMSQNMGQPPNVPPPPPIPIVYCISVNGQTSQPYNLQLLQQMAQSGQLTRESYVWKQGMTGWELAGNVAELTSIFSAVPPPPI